MLICRLITRGKFSLNRCLNFILTSLRKNDILFNRQFVALSMWAGSNHFQTPTVYMTSTSPDGNSMQIPIPFSDPASRTSPFYGYGENFGIWSCRFSADGNEVVAGGSGKIFGQSLALDLNHNDQHLK